MEQRTCRPIYLGAIVWLSSAILLVCLPHLARCGAAHPVIMSAKSSNQQANTLTQHPQPSQSSSEQMYQLGRSHQHPYSAQAASSIPNKPGQPNLPALSTQNSYAYEDQLANSQHHQQQAILTRSGQRLQSTQANFNRAALGTSASVAGGQSNFVMTNQQQQQQQQLNSMLANPYTNATHMLLLDLRQQLITRAIKFDEHFRNLLSKSKVGLHNMFVETYGLIYEHNTEIFTNMYEDLTQYYATGQIKLTESMNNFFMRLYQKIFQVYNSTKAFSHSYLECATQQLVVLKPFKDAPENLISDIKRVFVAARTLNQALNAGIDLIKSIISLGSPPQCISLTSDKLLRQAEGGKPPCLSYCGEVISRCIGRNNLDTLSNSWKSYVTTLSDLAKMLGGRYNIANIITPIDVQISEAIMNFQDNAQNISQLVFEACSKEPKASQQNPAMQIHNRLSRRAAPGTLTPNSARRNVNQRPAGVNEQQFDMDSRLDRLYGGSAASTSSFGRMQQNIGLVDTSKSDLQELSHRTHVIVDEIRTYMLSTKGFWSSLPNSVCAMNQNQSATAGSNLPTLASRKSSPANCFSEPLAIWDMNSDLRYTLEINQLIDHFKAMESKIRDAIAGKEIDWSPGMNQRPVGNGSTYASTRPPIVSFPTTTTISTTPDEEPDDSSDDALETSDEEGSGNPDKEDDEFAEDTEEPEPDDQTNPEESQTPMGPPEFPVDTLGEGNSIDPKPNYDTDNPGLITVDPSPRKSGAVSQVILQDQLKPLLASLFSLFALSIVTIFHTNQHHLMIARRT